jgi:hypothetical protein
MNNHDLFTLSKDLDDGVADGGSLLRSGGRHDDWFL